MAANSIIRSILRRIRSEATAALVCNGDNGAIGLIGFMESLIDENGLVSDNAISIASEVLYER